MTNARINGLRWRVCVPARALPCQPPMLALILAVVAGCSLQRYEAAPPDVVRVPQEMAVASLTSPVYRDLLAQAGADEAWPPAAWSPFRLGLIAAARSHAVTAARSAILAASARQRAAVQRQNPQINLSLEHHSARQNVGDSRWSIGPSIDLSLVPPEVRHLAGERAGLDVAIARLDALESAWQIHDAAVDAALTVRAQREQARQFTRAARLRDDAVAAARALVAAGVTDPFEWETLILERNDARLARLARTTALATAQAELAAALALPGDAVADIALVDDTVPPLPAPDVLQADMLKSHPAVLRALAVHAQAERDLALAIAAQYPSLQLSPGYFFDQGDHVWSLLGGIVVPLFASHEAAIASAAAARDAAREEVYAAQARAIVELQRAYAQWQAATTVQADARQLVEEVSRAHDELARQRHEGIGDDLAVARAALQVAESHAQFAAIRAEVLRTRITIAATARLAALDPPFARWLTTLTSDLPGKGE